MTNDKCAQKQNILKKALSDCPSANVRPLFNSGVVGIPKYLKNACKTCYLNIFGYAKNTTSDCPTLILRPHYNRYLCHITNQKWSLICTRTNRNDFF